jgi:hypothetical protein
LLEALLRLCAEFGPAAAWLTIFIAVVIAVFVLYVGIALHAVLRAKDREQREIRYQVFRDLLDLFRRRKQP